MTAPTRTPPLPSSSQEGTAARLRDLAEQWTRKAAEQRHTHNIGINRVDNAGIWREKALIALGRAQQAEACAAELLAVLEQKETPCNPS